MGRLFSDKQRSIIFVRDHAICAFSGKNLWLLDSGIINWDWDWIDHIIPHSKNGKTEIENGILLSSQYNYMLGNVKNKYYKFVNGYPSIFYFEISNIIDSEIKNRLIRFSKLEMSDWCFNRAIAHVLFALDYLTNNTRLNGSKRKRDDLYYANVAFKKLKDWENLRDKEGTSSFEDRNLVVNKPEFDQNNFLKLRNCKSVEDIRNIINAIYPYYQDYIDIENYFYEKYEKLIDLKFNKQNFKDKTKLLNDTLNSIKNKLDTKTMLPRHLNIMSHNLNSIKDIFYN